MASGGFGKWFEEQKDLEEQNDVSAGGAESPWSQLWSGLGAGEKKADDEADPAESQGFLESMALFADGVKTSAADASGLNQEASLFGLSYQTRFKGFVATIFMSGFFFFMAFAVGMPVIVLRPSKFALCFTVGSLMFMSSFALLKGPSAHIMSMLTLDRLPFTATYVGSMLSTLYASLVIRSYVLVVITSGIQMCTLAYYFLSFIPGGTAGAKVFVYTFMKTARMAATATFTILKGCLKMVSS